MSGGDPAAVVRAMFEARHKGDAEAYLRCISDDFVAVGLDGTRYEGHAVIRAFFEGLGDETEQDTHASAEMFLANGDRVVVLGRLYTLGARGMTGRALAWEFVVRDGLVSRCTAYARVADVPDFESFAE
jgi:ketosteroid isomerase-like protein